MKRCLSGFAYNDVGHFIELAKKSTGSVYPIVRRHAVHFLGETFKNDNFVHVSKNQHNYTQRLVLY